MKFRKKPVVIDAVQWLGTKESWDEIMAMGNVPWEPGEMGSSSFVITTIDGNKAIITPGVWVCKGIAGEFYPCEPHIFEQTYEPVKCYGSGDLAKEAAAAVDEVLAWVDLGLTD